MWDVIVVGARCAGAVTALRFARSGKSVLVLDKGRLGSHTLSTHVLVSSAIQRFDELGLLEVIRDTGAPPIQSILVEFNGRAFPTSLQEAGGYFLCVRRTTLDPLLVKAAEQAGATVRHGMRVDQLLWEDERVVGVSVRDHSGGEHIERGRLVVGADGRHSVVAQRVRASEYNIMPCPSAACYAYFQGIGATSVGTDVLQFASGPECEVLCSPCDGNIHIALLIVQADEFATIKRGGIPAFEARLRTIPAFAPRATHAQVVSKLYPASQAVLRGYFRAPFGSGWALVGDAGYYAHPASANGIADALRSAELLHTFVEQAWGQGQPAETYLQEYQNIRDTENTEPFYFSYRLGKVNPFTDPEVAAAFTGGQA